jgi:membrane-associated phospholipid phosphatase
MDEWLLRFFNQTLAGPVLDAVMTAVSVVGLALCPGVAVALLWERPNPASPFHRKAGGEARPGKNGPWRRRRTGLALLAALVVGLGLTLAFQYSVGRPRPGPDVVQVVLAAPNYPSFPSGHAMAGFATAAVLGLAARRWRLAVLLVGGATLLGLSRVYLGHHYPSDVLAGAVLGAGVGAAAYGLLVERAPGVARWRWMLWIQLALIVLVSQVAYMGRLPLAWLRLPYTDKVLHFLMFGSVVFWLNLWLPPRRLAGIPLAVAVPFGLAVLEEGAQSFSSWRSAGLDDLAADLAGMVLFWFLSERLKKNVPEVTPTL